MQYGSQYSQFQANVHPTSRSQQSANPLAAQFSSPPPTNTAPTGPIGSMGSMTQANAKNVYANNANFAAPYQGKPTSNDSVAHGGYGLPAGVQPGFNFSAIRVALGTSGLKPEPPLLEELGINFKHVQTKGLTVLNPFKAVDKHIMDDTDLAGPLIFCLAFGAFLLLAGKLQFGYVYGLSFTGGSSIYLLLNLMSDYGVSFSQTASVLGYCLLPMVILSVFNFILGLPGLIGYIFPCFSVLWCTYSASNMFTAVLSMTSQKALVAYPIGLFYSLFALLCVF